MNYKKLRREAVKGAYFLTKALLEDDVKLIELETFKLNDTIDQMLQIIKKEKDNEQNTLNTTERVSPSAKRR
jgi:hypothetical protein